MIFSENRYTLFRIMLKIADARTFLGCSRWCSDTNSIENFHGHDTSTLAQGISGRARHGVDAQRAYLPRDASHYAQVRIHFDLLTAQVSDRLNFVRFNDHLLRALRSLAAGRRVEAISWTRSPLPIIPPSR